MTPEDEARAVRAAARRGVEHLIEALADVPRTDLCEALLATIAPTREARHRLATRLLFQGAENATHAVERGPGFETFRIEARFRTD